MKIFARTLLIFTLLLASSTLLEAQVPGGGGAPPGGSPTCWPPPCVPIDGGVSFLLIAGVAFGAKKVIDLRK